MKLKGAVFKQKYLFLILILLFIFSSSAVFGVSKTYKSQNKINCSSTEVISCMVADSTNVNSTICSSAGIQKTTITNTYFSTDYFLKGILISEKRDLYKTQNKQNVSCTATVSGVTLSCFGGADLMCNNGVSLTPLTPVGSSTQASTCGCQQLACSDSTTCYFSPITNTEVCRGTCIQCTSDANCNVDPLRTHCDKNPVNGSQACVQCLDDSDCPDSKCNLNMKTCVECTTDADCTFDSNRPACDAITNKCVKCTSASQCPAGQTCTDNNCAALNCPGCAVTCFSSVQQTTTGAAPCSENPTSIDVLSPLQTIAQTFNPSKEGDSSNQNSVFFSPSFLVTYLVFFMTPENISLSGEPENILKESPQANLCEMEGAYTYILNTKESAQSSNTLSLTLPNAYTVNAQNSENQCTCIRKNNLGTPIQNYTWSDAAKNHTSYGCCGPTKLGNNAGLPSTCSISADNKAICDSPLSKYVNGWHIISEENIGCAYNTSCFNNAYVLSNNDTWIQCSKTVNSDNKLIYARNISRGENSFGCFQATDTSGDGAKYAIYECKFENANAPGNPVPTICAVDSDLYSKAANPNGDAYVNTTKGTIYCLVNGTFDYELDWNDQIHQSTCARDGYFWTGSKCCGEPGDKNEFYNDLNDTPISMSSQRLSGFKGACFNSTFVGSGQTLAQSNLRLYGGAFNTSQIINANGTFYGCNLSDNYILSMKDSFTNGSLITSKISTPGLGYNNLQLCSALINITNSASGINSKSFFCSSEGKWKGVAQNLIGEDGSIQIQLSNITPGYSNTNMPKQDCCQRSQCWNGTACTYGFQYYRNKFPNESSYAMNAIQYAGTKDYICVEQGDDRKASWFEFTGNKSTWTDRYSLFCQREDQCLVDPYGKPYWDDHPENYTGIQGQNPMCISNGQYIADHYCNNGVWTTRTKLIAEKMIKYVNYVNTDYTLFCDASQNSLNFLNYTKLGRVAASEVQNANNFCVLTTPTHTAFGVSLNKLSNESGMLEIFGVNATACIKVDATKKCNNANTAGWTIYYEEDKKLLFFSRYGDFKIENIIASDKFENKFSTKDFNSKIKTLSSGTASNGMPFAEKTHNYEKIFSMKKGQKSVFGYKDTTFYNDFTDYLAVKYDGFNSSVCDKVKDLVVEDSSNPYCKKEGNTQYVFGSSFPAKKVVDAWPDFTAKIRVD